MIQIVFENNEFVICDKPCGVLSTPSRFEDDDARFCLGTALQDSLKTQIYPVHRLDFEVSGLVMYAKNPQAHRQANAWFEKKEIQKRYHALTTGQDFSHIPANISNPREVLELQVGRIFEWKGRILRGKRRAFASPQGKDSLTLATYLGTILGTMDELAGGRATQAIHQWDLYPVTGRSHQLRFDLSRHGFPIVADSLYGSALKWHHEQGIALRSYCLDFAKAPGARALGLPEQIAVDKLK